MSTRACYRFIDHDRKPLTYVTVYKHHDGYPSGALEAINKALDYAWPLPRFEADDFAAAFVAANKRPEGPEYQPGGRYFDMRGGGVRLVADKGPGAHWRFACDTEFLYDIFTKDRKLHVTCYAISGGFDAKTPTLTKLNSGELGEMTAWANEHQG